MRRSFVAVCLCFPDDDLGTRDTAVGCTGNGTPFENRFSFWNPFGRSFLLIPRNLLGIGILRIRESKEAILAELYYFQLETICISIWLSMDGQVLKRIRPGY